MTHEILTIPTDTLTPPSSAGNLWQNRVGVYSRFDQPGMPVATIIVTGYNRLDKTRRCVEDILKYSSDVDYELILIDNGSTDDTLDYFKSVQFDKKKIIHVTKNVGAGFPSTTAFSLAQGKYIFNVQNDLNVTPKWLSNLICCYESDPSIGMCMPVSSNTSNLQQVDLEFSNHEEMQTEAAKFNVSDPSKWDERMRLITLPFSCPRHVLDIIGVGDPAFVHDFVEDDFAVRLRRSGYRLVLCKDTWVHHDHNLRNMEDKDPVAFKASLESGRAIYKEKWHCIDAWDDICNFELNLLAPIDTHNFYGDDLSTLCIDVRCGTPVLEVRNRLRWRGIMEVDSYAFTTQAKYYVDLNCDAVCGNDIVCDRIDFIQDHYADNSFDIVVLGEPVNTYNAPITLLQRLWNFIKPGGLLLFKLRNTNDVNSLMLTLGIGGIADSDMPVQISVYEMIEMLKLFGGSVGQVVSEQRPMSEADMQTISRWIKAVKGTVIDGDLTRLLTRDYLFSVTKSF